MEKTLDKKFQPVRFYDLHNPESEIDTDGNGDGDGDEEKMVTISSSALRSGGDMHSVSSISTSILDDEEEVKLLKLQLSDTQNRNRLLEMELQKMTACLSDEINKNLKLEKKLQFVKDNQEIFMRLKEAYINMKYNEAAGRKMVEIREKGVQTWEGILCRGCIAAEQLRRQIDNLKEMYKDCYIVNRNDMDHLINTIKYLKDVIQRRETSWMKSCDHQSKLEEHLSLLEQENCTLKNLLKCHSTRHSATDPKEESPWMTEIGDQAANNVEIMQLKKIIVKFERAFREMTEKSHDGLILAPSLNDKERKVVQQLIAKYQARIGKTIKSRSHSREDSKKLASRGSSRCGSREGATRTPRNVVITQNTDLAMAVMDFLFDES